MLGRATGGVTAYWRPIQAGVVSLPKLDLAQ